MILIRYEKIVDFEYDIQGLLRSFYPGEETATDKDIEARLILSVDISDDILKLGLSDSENAPVCMSEPIDREDRKQTKNILKRMLYNILADYSGKQLPWGTLSGIRPTKITSELLKDGHSTEWVREHMKSEYYVSDVKTDLSIEISSYELELLSSIDYENGYSVYIGIPFCPSICSYCSFSSYPLIRYKDKVDKYVDALLKEIEYVSSQYAGKKLNTVYIGGGTPTTLEPDQMERLLSYVRSRFDFTYVREFTVEAGRPDSITPDKLKVMKKYGVTRMSINPQSMNQKTLELIGRKHTVNQIYEAFEMSRNEGFDNINMDFIVGLPEETYEDVEYTLSEARKLMPDSITIHSLAVKRAARLNTMKEQYEKYSFRNNEEIMDMTRDYAISMGMKPYYLYRQKNMTGNMENVGYAVPGKAGIYNILIMEEKQSIIAIGAGASTKMVFPGGKRIERIENVKDVDCYIDRIDEMIGRKRQFLKEYKEVL